MIHKLSYSCASVSCWLSMFYARDSSPAQYSIQVYLICLNDPISLAFFFLTFVCCFWMARNTKKLEIRRKIVSHRYFNNNLWCSKNLKNSFRSFCFSSLFLWLVENFVMSFRSFFFHVRSLFLYPSSGQQSWRSEKWKFRRYTHLNHTIVCVFIALHVDLHHHCSEHTEKKQHFIMQSNSKQIIWKLLNVNRIIDKCSSYSYPYYSFLSRKCWLLMGEKTFITLRSIYYFCRVKKNCDFLLGDVWTWEIFMRYLAGIYQFNGNIDVFRVFKEQLF